MKVTKRPGTARVREPIEEGTCGRARLCSQRSRAEGPGPVLRPGLRTAPLRAAAPRPPQPRPRGPIPRGHPGTEAAGARRRRRPHPAARSAAPGAAPQSRPPPPLTGQLSHEGLGHQRHVAKGGRAGRGHAQELGAAPPAGQRLHPGPGRGPRLPRPRGAAPGRPGGSAGDAPGGISEHPGLAATVTPLRYPSPRAKPRELPAGHCLLSLCPLSLDVGHKGTEPQMLPEASRGQ